MSLSNRIAIEVVTALDNMGFLKNGVRWRDQTIVPKLTEIIRAELIHDRLTLKTFMIWWAEISHREGKHINASTSPFAPQDFRHCLNSMCLSLLGTIHDLSNEITPAPEPVSNASSTLP